MAEDVADDVADDLANDAADEVAMTLRLQITAAPPSPSYSHEEGAPRSTAEGTAAFFASGQKRIAQELAESQQKVERLTVENSKLAQILAGAEEEFASQHAVLTQAALATQGEVLEAAFGLRCAGLEAAWGAERAAWKALVDPIPMIYCLIRTHNRIFNDVLPYTDA
jgi:hypothetical protein